MTTLLVIALAVAQPAGSMSTPRFTPSMTVLLDGRVLVAGGSAPGQSLSSAEIYDPVTQTFRPTSAPMANVHNSPSAVLLNDGRVMVDGGNFITAPAIEIYDPASDTFSAPEQPASRHLEAPLLKLPDGRILLAGGTDSLQVPTTLVEIFDPASGHWSRAADLSIARWAQGEVLFPDGRVLIAGGRGTSEYPDSELYDPAAGTSTVIQQTFSQPIAVPLAGARAAVVETASFWTFDEASASFTQIIPSLRATNQAVTLLSNGFVLLAGGVEPIAGVPQPAILMVDANLGALLSGRNIDRGANARQRGDSQRWLDVDRWRVRCEQLS